MNSDPSTAHPDYPAIAAWWESYRQTAIAPEVVYWSLKLMSTEGIVEDLEEINQTIQVILTTTRRSDPHRPEFASDLLTLIDAPVNRFEPYALRETSEAIDLWEPRADIDTQEVERSDPQGRVKLTVRWTLSSDVNLGDEATVTL